VRSLLLGCVVAGVMGLSASAFGTQPPTNTETTVQTSQPQQHEDTRQFADEIIRRLRRLGINYSRTRISHPYDPDGSLC
jgi:hypothetical protein